MAKINSADVAWARTHDWFIEALPLAHEELSADSVQDFAIIAKERWHSHSGGAQERRVVLTEYHTLRAWAGY